MVDVLGPEIMECMAWRKGALMYMYCATVQEEDKARIEEDPQSFAEVTMIRLPTSMVVMSGTKIFWIKMF